MLQHHIAITHAGTSNWLNLWPIFLAPVIPLIGLTVKNPRVRNAAIAVVGGTVVVGAHSVAMSTSTFTK